MEKPSIHSKFGTPSPKLPTANGIRGTPAPKLPAIIVGTPSPKPPAPKKKSTKILSGKKPAKKVVRIEVRKKAVARKASAKRINISVTELGTPLPKPPPKKF